AIARRSSSKRGLVPRSEAAGMSKSGTAEAELDAVTTARRAWLGVLAKASAAELEAAWRTLPDPPSYRLLRPTETGLARVRGRIGGGGQPFNLGEMTMTRAAVQLLVAGEPRQTGFGHVAGRSARHAELVALFDAILQDPARHDAIATDIVA